MRVHERTFHQRLIVRLLGAALVSTMLGSGTTPAIAADHSVGAYTIRWAAQEVPEDFVYRGRDFASALGLKVEIETNPSASRSLQDLIAGRVDIADVGSAPALSAMERDAGNLLIVGASHSGGQRHEVLVAPNSPIHSIEDLKQKRIAMPIGSGAYLGWELYLKKHGWSDQDFQIVNMQPPDMASALAQNQVDAVLVWEPTASILVTKHIGREVGNMSEVTTDPGVLITTRDFAAAHADALERYLASDARMYAFIRQQPMQAAAIAARVAGENGAKVGAQAFVRAFQHMTFDMSLSRADLSSLDDVAKYMVSTQKLQAAPVFSQVVDLKYLHAAMGIADVTR